MRPFRYTLLLIVPLLALAGCEETSRLFAHRHRPAPQPSVAHTAFGSHYVLNITLAQLALLPPGNTPAALRYLRHIKPGKAQNTYFSLAVLAMDYTVPPAKDKQTLLVPVPPAADPSDFKAMKIVLKHLSRTHYTLQDMHAYTVTFMPPTDAPFSRSDPALLRQQLADRQQQIMTGATPLSPVDDAKLQLNLVRVFMHHRVRDAAYLALENAKNALAQATSDSSADQAEITALSKDADALGNTLHKDMPYTL